MTTPSRPVSATPTVATGGTNNTTIDVLLSSRSNDTMGYYPQPHNFHDVLTTGQTGPGAVSSALPSPLPLSSSSSSDVPGATPVMATIPPPPKSASHGILSSLSRSSSIRVGDFPQSQSPPPPQPPQPQLQPQLQPQVMQISGKTVELLVSQPRQRNQDTATTSTSTSSTPAPPRIHANATINNATPDPDDDPTIDTRPGETAAQRRLRVQLEHRLRHIQFVISALYHLANIVLFAVVVPMTDAAAAAAAAANTVSIGVPLHCSSASSLRMYAIGSATTAVLHLAADVAQYAAGVTRWTRWTARYPAAFRCLSMLRSFMTITWFALGNIWILGVSPIDTRGGSTLLDIPCSQTVDALLFTACKAWLIVTYVVLFWPLAVAALLVTAIVCLPCCMMILPSRWTLAVARSAGWPAQVVARINGLTPEEVARLPLSTFRDGRPGPPEQGKANAVPAAEKIATTDAAPLSVSAAGAGATADECTICLEKFQDGEQIITLPCAHFFHKTCCEPWLKLNGSCALCRRYATPDGTNPRLANNNNNNNNNHPPNDARV